MMKFGSFLSLLTSPVRSPTTKRMAKTSLASFIMMILIVGMTMIVVQGEEKDTNTNSNRQKKTDSVYERYDAIDLVIEKLWSKGNPSETYGYQQLPFCDVKASTATSLGEELTGSGDSVISKYDIGFQGKFRHGNL